MQTAWLFLTFALVCFSTEARQTGASKNPSFELICHTSCVTPPTLVIILTVTSCSHTYSIKLITQRVVKKYCLYTCLCGGWYSHTHTLYKQFPLLFA